jgi:hypothetical protein
MLKDKASARKEKEGYPLFIYFILFCPSLAATA